MAGQLALTPIECRTTTDVKYYNDMIPTKHAKFIQGRMRFLPVPGSRGNNSQLGYTGPVLVDILMSRIPGQDPWQSSSPTTERDLPRECGYCCKSGLSGLVGYDIDQREICTKMTLAALPSHLQRLCIDLSLIIFFL